MTPHEPRRRCVGCGRSAPQRELVRLALEDGHVVVDRERRRPGRGAYICAGGGCLDAAAAPRALARAFRRTVIVDDETVRLVH